MAETGEFDRSDEPLTAEAADPMHRPEVVDPLVDLLAELADGGPALELGVGTGRIALPLAARGVSVHGIDLSEEAVPRLRAKPGGEASASPSATSRRPGCPARSSWPTSSGTRS